MDNPLTLLPGYMLRRAAQTMIGSLAERLAALDLRVSEASVLLLVGHHTDHTASMIGRTLDIQRANMVPLLKRLEDAGLVNRVPLDRKSFAVVLSPAGLELLGRLQPLVTQFEDDLMARIPAQHRSHFLPALQALLD